MEFHYPDDSVQDKKARVLLLTFVSVVVLLGIVGGSLYVYKQFFVARPVANSRSAQPLASPLGQSSIAAYQTVQGRYLFNGTVVLARAVEKYARGDYNQPFSQLDSFNRGAYDAWSADFECPITDNRIPYQDQVNHLMFNCRPEFLPNLAKYFNLIDLANNHTDNQGGQAGLVETRKKLDAQTGVQYFGNYDPTITQDICEVVALPVRLQNTGNEQKASLPVAFCGWHYFNYNRGPSQTELDVAKQYSQYMPVFAFAEMGVEYQAKASPQQVAIAHQIINTGAEFLMANNPHWVQNAEVYNGKLIVYSLGNFIFDQIDPETQQGVSIDATTTTAYDQNVAQWIELGKECSAFKDSCLQKAKDKNLKKVQLKLMYSPVANQNGAGKVTRKADPAIQAAVEQRLNWAEVVKQLGQ